MTTVIVEIENGGNIVDITAAMRALKGVAKVTVRGDRAQGQIPGVPCTPEQLRASVSRAQQQRKKGLGVEQKDAFAKYEEMYKGMPGW